MHVCILIYVCALPSQDACTLYQAQARVTHSIYIKARDTNPKHQSSNKGPFITTKSKLAMAGVMGMDLSPGC